MALTPDPNSSVQFPLSQTMHSMTWLWSASCAKLRAAPWRALLTVGRLLVRLLMYVCVFLPRGMVGFNHARRPGTGVPED